VRLPAQAAVVSTGSSGGGRLRALRAPISSASIGRSRLAARRRMRGRPHPTAHPGRWATTPAPTPALLHRDLGV